MSEIITGNNVDVLRTMKGGYVDLTVTSPPYEDLRKYNGFSLDFDGLVSELYRVTKEGGVVVWVVGDKTVKGSESGMSFRQALKFIDAGFRLHDTMIYEKDSLSFPDKTRYNQIFEYMFVFSKSRPKTINLIKDRPNKHANGRKHIKGNYRTADGQTKRHNKQNLLQPLGVRNNIWRISTGCNKSTTDKEAYKHPAIFPEKLANDHIITWSNEGDVVLDPFGGSGTTAKMAALNNRQYIHIDCSEDYNEIARGRLAKV
ncbi:site-specific DNA-methyltransferase [Thalassobacillus sp. CUG 92003]|uniref:DNA-methyltransferase n=1 Tax=Thalassobacillus sp. CUG 92003 TaxID=2736641 RepID=UPI0015E71865|nr:site-specific DNA-methyltransferase [Thalassobacillus sp. CUG 92003]